MKVYRALLLLISTTLLSGCFTTTITNVEPQLASTQLIVTHENGDELLVSERTNHVTFGPLSAIYDEKKNSTYFITIQNNSSDDFIFSTDDIRAYYDGEPLRVYNYDQIIWALDMQERHEVSVASREKLSNSGSSRFSRLMTALSGFSGNMAIHGRFDELRSIALDRVKIGSGQLYSGIIMLGEIKSTEEGKDLIVFFQIGGEKHELHFHVIEREVD